MGYASPFLLCLALVHITGINAVSFEEDTAITAKEAEVLFKFRDRVRPKLPHKYMEESIFLVRWLRAKGFDINAAEEMLMQHIKWREENRMDKIDNEDWQDFKSDYEWNLDGVDKEGRPLLQIILKDWDIRQAMVTGRRGPLRRWIYKYYEDATKRVRKFQDAGRNVTQFSMVIDAEGFNPITHGCPSCIPLYLTIARAYEEQYPGSVDNIHIVNTPEMFRVIMRLLWPLLAPNTRQALHMYGSDRNAWRRTLAETIDGSQLLSQFGGYLKTAE